MIEAENRSVSRTRYYSQYFVVVTAIFITCLITANIIAVKLISIFNLVLPAAIIIFPISYIVGDVLTEVYGFSNCTVIMHILSLDLPATITDVILKDDMGVEIETISSFNKEISGNGAITPITVTFNPETFQVTNDYWENNARGYTITLTTESGRSTVSSRFKFTY